MQKHSALIALRAASQAYETAQQDCPHWDYEDNPLGVACDCCVRLQCAYSTVVSANKAYMLEVDGDAA